MQENRIQALIEPVIQRLGFELWACQLHQQGQYSLLRIYIDSADGAGVTLDDCTTVSHEVSAILDVEDVIKSHYNLEVSSPGMDRILLTLSHFERYLDSDVKVKLRVAHLGKKQFVGRIIKVADDKVFFGVEQNTIGVTLGEIQKANLIVR
ncbi:MAG: ribosome maturation factor RimP [Gammaproteobacteria bacterium CG_4_10_14_0_8_um_filter_38_16]|nr:MAG: ribosome maturation factor RimP [Gammaproteobacteria bacterium CG_4_10_14_0_8_um_filter_38_16]PJA02991.1 MAG: ribosome maturation factor RimP [Gammaproteobacteria bacterium CG_4_10_14_0_2_um_filter_38_22]PJB09457.1 MAG: ribosome maturation factor RimP [Gammaproteobacteria bacterium CG_4_9_14_3_um_filter_38_9]